MAKRSPFVYKKRVGSDGSGSGWTEGEVQERLIAAFRALPSHPVFSQRGRMRPTLGDTLDHAMALNWVARFVPDADERLVLLTWARCKANRESANARYQALGWRRSTAEDGRRRAVRRIVAALHGRQPELDSRTIAAGASSPAEVAPDLARA